MTVATAETATSRSDVARFFGWLLVATAIPFALFPVATHVLPDDVSIGRATAAVLFLGSGGHVAASFFFYGDPVMRRLMLREYRPRFVLAPILLLVGVTAISWAYKGTTVLAYLIVVYWIWQTHHYNRQNLGILSFVSRAERKPIRDRDRLALTLAGVAAILGMIRFVTPWQSTFLQTFGWQLDTAARGVFAVAWLVYLPSLLRDDPREAPWRTGMLLAAMLFYLPLFFFEDAFSAVMTYAIAHGLQYHVFMGFVARTPHGSRTRRLAALAVWTLVGGLVLDLSTRRHLWGELDTAVYGAGLAIVMWHFVLDAGIWRLSEPGQRAYMAERFPFL